jgi:hypothetical protein
MLSAKTQAVFCGVAIGLIAFCVSSKFSQYDLHMNLLGSLYKLSHITVHI